MRNPLIITLMLVIVTAISGCSAIHTSTAKKQLNVQTKMSESIFLEPVAPEKRIVYVQIRNTSDKPNVVVEEQIKKGIRANGYQITDNPEQANFWLQANILQVGQRNDDDFRGADGAITGAAIGSTMGQGDGKVAMAVAGALLATMIDASVHDTYYTMITDVRISQRTTATVTESQHSSMSQGTSGKQMSKSTEQTHWKRYQTRVVSVANKVNLQFEEAQPALVDGLVHNLSNLF